MIKRDEVKRKKIIYIEYKHNASSNIGYLTYFDFGNQRSFGTFPSIRNDTTYDADQWSSNLQFKWKNQNLFIFMFIFIYIFILNIISLIILCINLNVKWKLNTNITSLSLKHLQKTKKGL